MGDFLKVSKVLITFFVNILGCFLAGVFLVYIDQMPEFYSAIALAGCGSLTTFSSLCLETSNFLEDKKITRAILLLVGSLVFGVVVIELGVFMGNFFL